MRRPQLSPTVSITLGLVSLVLLLVVAVDFLVGLPDDRQALRTLREQVAMTLAVQVSNLLEDRHHATLLKTLAEVARHNDDILSIGVRRRDGELLAATGPHRRHWHPPSDGRSSLEHVQVPLLQGGQPWGTVEVRFRAARGGLLGRPAVLLPLVLLLGGGLLFYLYLRRALVHLDPSQVIPERVRNALNVLTEAVLIMDRRGRILLVNDAFRGLHPAARQVRMGQPVDALHWLQASSRLNGEAPAWERALASRETVTQERIDLPLDSGEIRHLLVNAAPVRDDDGQVRGCLVTMEDITEQERTLAALRASQAEIEAKNRELLYLANYDQLSGVFNRRAFFEHGARAFRECLALGRPLACLMSDIDHFKSINDNYGHPVGDEAIRSIACLLRECVRESDIVGRYGGEEFCVLLPDVSPAVARQVAERIRREVERRCGAGVESVPDLRITASFGLSLLAPDVESLEQLIEHADQALYRAKAGGRNRVTLYVPPETTDAPRADREASAA